MSGMVTFGVLATGYERKELDQRLELKINILEKSKDIIETITFLKDSAQHALG